MTEQNTETIEEKIKGAEGLLDLGFFEDAAAVYQTLVQECPDDYRVWLGLARVQSRNFTQSGNEVQPCLDRAADCARTVDAYNDLQETAGWFAAIKPFAYARQVNRALPDTEQLSKIKPVRVPISNEEGVRQAREISRLTYLKFLLALVLIIGLPVGFIVSCANGVNPITNAIRGESVSEVDAPTRRPGTGTSSTGSADDTTTRPDAVSCPYATPSADISAGMTGETVQWVQWCLTQTGYPTEITGTYDTATEEAVRQFQTAYGIRIDGIVGPETRAQFHTMLPGLQ